MDNWTRTTQARTTVTADNHRERYTQDEIDFVQQLAHEPISELATALGRTYFAISTLKQMIAAGKITAGSARVAASDRPYRGWVEGMGDE